MYMYIFIVIKQIKTQKYIITNEIINIAEKIKIVTIPTMFYVSN